MSTIPCISMSEAHENDKDDDVISYSPILSQTQEVMPRLPPLPHTIPCPPICLGETPIAGYLTQTPAWNHQDDGETNGRPKRRLPCEEEESTVEVDFNEEEEDISSLPRWVKRPRRATSPTSTLLSMEDVTPEESKVGTLVSSSSSWGYSSNRDYHPFKRPWDHTMEYAQDDDYEPKRARTTVCA